jgi:hypothetical protein
MMGSKLQEALSDPKSVFSQPKEVLDASFLSEGQMRQVLARWEADARELQVAAEEGMDGGESDMLGRVREALRSLGDTENPAPPTKQGG